MSTRQGAERGGGLGLGLFIAKTLLERSGATLSFRNSNTPGEGALVEIIWPRAAFLAPVQARRRCSTRSDWRRELDKPAH